MKKIAIAAGIILTIIIVGIILINVNDQDTEITREQTKVGMILNGTRDDQSYSQAHYESMEKTAKELNLFVIYKESVPYDETCKEMMENMIHDGCEIIICNSFNYEPWIVETAKEYPEVYFLHATGTQQGENLTSFFGRMYQIRYLSGVIAGLQTETNEIGYVAAYPIAEVNRGINAFTLGARSVNPDVTVHVEWTNSWTDDAICADATEQLLAGHDIDVLAMHVDSIEPLRIADAQGVYTIGYNLDNSEAFPDTYLTAAVWQWDAFYTPQILECLQGKFKGSHEWLGIDSDMMALAPLTENVKEGTAEIVEKEQAKLMTGTYDVFYGPITDQSGTVRVLEGECMSDESMLDGFDWYVEGVVICDEK